jgi:type IX secretion system PorP/SprF family membrane protein
MKLFNAITKASLVSGFVIVGVNNAKSQDFHLSMYDAAPLFLNPAMTGVFEGDWRIHLHHRTQWKAVNFKPYTSYLASFDMPYNKWGFGIQLQNFRAGWGNYNAFQGLLSAAYTLSVDAQKSHNISFGLQAGFVNKSLEAGLHTFNNQYVTTNGGGFDSELNSNENFARQSVFVPEVNFGTMYYYAKQQSRLNPFVGFSMFNLLQPKETFFGGDNKLPLRTYINVGTRINITDLFFLIPKALIMHQKPGQEINFGLDGGYYLKHSETYLLAGTLFRNKDAFMLYLGARKASYIAKIGYDINFSTLRPASSGRGAFEISFTYMKQKAKPREGKICPRL